MQLDWPVGVCSAGPSLIFSHFKPGQTLSDHSLEQMLCKYRAKSLQLLKKASKLNVRHCSASDCKIKVFKPFD